MKNHFNILIKGKVQAVGFRFNTKLKARELNIKGFIQNLPDNSVYIEAEGIEKNLNNFISWCKTGPKNAKVEQIKIRKSKLQNFNTFEIL